MVMWGENRGAVREGGGSLSTHCLTPSKLFCLGPQPAFLHKGKKLLNRLFGVGKQKDLPSGFLLGHCTAPGYLVLLYCPEIEVKLPSEDVFIMIMKRCALTVWEKLTFNIWQSGCPWKTGWAYINWKHFCVNLTHARPYRQFILYNEKILYMIEMNW